MHPRTLMIMVLAAGLLPLGSRAAEPGEFATLVQKRSYALGLTLGANWKALGVEVDLDRLLQGLRDVQAGRTNTPLDTNAAARELNALKTELVERDDRVHKRLASERLKEGKDFLVKNAARAGVQTLADDFYRGLQYLQQTDGKGALPHATNRVKVNFTASFLETNVWTKFDSSPTNGAVIWALDGQLAGIRGAMQVMRPGARWKVYVPPDLGYGEIGTAKVPPNAVLLYDLEFVAVFEPPGASLATGAGADPAAPPPGAASPPR